MFENWGTRLRAIWRPEMYHGHGKTRDFFEGWYFKCVDAGERHVLAVIPGVFLGREAGKSHSFVQVLDGLTGRSTYHTYPLSAFSASEHIFDVSVGPNRFRADGIQLDIARPEQRLCGRLRFDGLTPWPVTLTSPGVVGPFAFVPFMECYHGVVSLDHTISGSLELDGERVDFGGGRGYIEKDWGQAFPQAWLWAQTNHFEQPGTCLTLSVATVPWLRGAFRGFVVGLWHGGRLYRFTTYTGAQIESLRLSDTHALLRVAGRRHRLEIAAARAEGGLLHAPYRTDMLQRVTESLTATVDARLYAIDGGNERLLFSGAGRHAGLEINGNLGQIFD
jgi:tocopherol cyclase